MNFIDQHPNYKSYKHENYRLADLPIFFNRDLNGLIHALLMKQDAEEIIYNAWSLQNQLAVFVKMNPSERGPYDYLIDEIRRVISHITKKEFYYTMDAIGILLSITGEEEEINEFLSENDLGYYCYLDRGTVIWHIHEGVIDASEIQPSLLDKLTNRGKPKNGFFAQVTQYEDTQTRKKYALKRLKSEFNENEVYRRRFRREITILKRLKKSKHPHIIPLIDSRYNEKSNEYWYLMPYAPSNLFDYIKKYNNSLEIDERLILFNQILDAIEMAHSLDILHRDLSAFNVLLNGDNQVWVSDFGLGKDYTNLSNQGYSAVPGYGSLMYVAPEQQDNLENATKKSDVYSLGKLLYFILTGRDPRTTDDSELFSSLINKATLIDPEGRYDDANAFKSEFSKYKSLYEKVNASPIRTVSDLVLQKKEFNWMEFHEIVLKAEINEHIYYDFLDPISEVLNDTDTIEKYISIIGNDVHKFIELYAVKLHECYKSVGWPFTSLNSFGYFLQRLYEKTADYPRCRLILLNELWYIAADADQWAIQDIIVSIINHNNIPDNIQLDFSFNIIETGKYFSKLDKVNLSTISGPLKNAILELRENQ
ncbi:MAG: serine/threonine protein kinase [Bacillaceae bacterium]|nr:serine/threonine protein kinase [Bacillaceae bacterium]